MFFLRYLQQWLQLLGVSMLPVSLCMLWAHNRSELSMLQAPMESHYEQVYWDRFSSNHAPMHVQASHMIIRPKGLWFLHAPLLRMRSNLQHPGWKIRSDWADFDQHKLHLYASPVLREMTACARVLRAQSFWFDLDTDNFSAFGDLHYTHGAHIIQAQRAHGSLGDARIDIMHGVSKNVPPNLAKDVCM